MGQERPRCRVGVVYVDAAEIRTYNKVCSRTRKLYIKSETSIMILQSIYIIASPNREIVVPVNQNMGMVTT